MKTYTTGAELDAALKERGYVSKKQRDEIIKSKGLRPVEDSYGENLARNFAGQGLLMGFGDELEAGVRTGFGLAGDYTDKRDEIRNQLKAWQEENPKAAMASEFGGALATGALGAGKMLAGKALTHGGGALARMAGYGAGEGALTGLGHAEGDTIGEQARGMAEGGVIGGVGGAAMYPVMRAGQGILNASARSSADKKIRTSLQDAGLNSPDEAVAAMRSAGGEGGIIADIPGMGGRMRGASSQPGAGQNLAVEAMERREAALPQMLDRAAKDISGTSKTPRQVMEAQKKATRANAKANYDPVMDTPVRATLPVLRSLESKVGKKSFNEAAESHYMRTGDKLTIDDAPEITDLRFWNDYQSGLYSKASKAGRSGDKKRQGDILAMRERVNKVFDAMTDDEFKAARRAYAMDTKTAEALDIGYDIMEKNKGRAAYFSDDVKDMIGEMTEEERKAVLKGVMGKLRTDILGTPQSADSARKLLVVPQTRAKIKEVLNGNEEMTDAFMERLGQISRQSQTAQSMPKYNSKTSAVQAEQAMQNEVEGFLGNLFQGNFKDAGKAALKSTGKMFSSGRNDKVNEETVRNLLLSGSRGEDYLNSVYSGGQVSPYTAGGGVSLLPAIYGTSQD